MPKIPTYSVSLDYKPARGDLDTAALPGQMLAKFGESVGGFSGKIAQQAELAERMKQAAAEATRANATAQAMAELRQTIADFDADTDPGSMMDRYLERAHGIRQGIADRIGDPQVRAQVEEDTAGFFGVQSALMQGERVRGASARGRQELDNHLVLYRDIAVDARHPLELDEVIDLAVGAIRRKAERGFLTAADAANLEQTFYADVSERQVRRAIAADPQSALASLKGGEDFATLPAERRARLTGEAERAVQDQAVAHTTAAAADRRAIEIRLPGFVEALRDGNLPDDGSFSHDSLIAAFGDDDGARYWAEIEDARAFGKATARVQWATPGEIASLLGNDADADGPGGAAPARSLLRQAVDRRNGQLWSKPADYALANPRIAGLHDALRGTAAQSQLPAALTSALQASGAPAPAAALADEDRHAATAAYANVTLAEQERLGLPADRRQVLPAAQAQELVARILDGDTKAAADTLSDLIATWGDAAPIALADLSRHGLPGEYRLLASLTEPAARQTFAKVLTAQAAEPGVLRGRAGDDAEAIDGLVSDAFQSIGGLANDPPNPSSPIAIAANGQGLSMPAAPARRGVVKRAPTVSEFPSPRPEPLYDDDGDPVVVWSPEDGEDVQVMIPEGVSLKLFAEMGEANRDLTWPEQMAQLSKFLWGQVWDLQRPITKLTDGLPSEQKFRREFRDVATIAIGIYAAAADIPLETILNYQKIAAYRSRFAPTEIISDDYGPLAERNVRNTELGYNLYKFGKIKAK